MKKLYSKPSTKAPMPIKSKCSQSSPFSPSFVKRDPGVENACLAGIAPVDVYRYFQQFFLRIHAGIIAIANGACPPGVPDFDEAISPQANPCGQAV
jgi:hypothetical protein